MLEYLARAITDSGPTGMHYVGNAAVRNYHLVYSHVYIFGSIFIATGDCLAVLILFYQLREQWISSWWRRVVCAVLLAGGISVRSLPTIRTFRIVLMRIHSMSGHALRRVP